MEVLKFRFHENRPRSNTQPGGIATLGSASPLDVFVRAARSPRFKGLWLPIEPQLN